MLVKFVASLDQAAFDALGSKDAGTLYYIADTQRVYKGSVLYSNDVVVLATLPATGITNKLYIINDGEFINSYIWDGFVFKSVQSTPTDEVLVDVVFNETTKVFTYTYANSTTKNISLAAVFLTKEDKANKGIANGYAPLDAQNKVPLVHLPDTLLGQVVFGGTVLGGTPVATLSTNAKTRLGTANETITLTNNATPITGYKANEGIYYIVTMVGNFAGLSLEVGDWLISTGESWRKIDNTDAVMSVNGKTGAVVLTAGDVGAAAASHTHALGDGTTPGFSDNNFTNILLAKLNALNVANSLTSTSTTDALSAAMGKQLQDTKQNKVAAATAGNIQVFTTGGDSGESGKSFGGATLPATGSPDKVPTEQAVVEAVSWH